MRPIPTFELYLVVQSGYASSARIFTRAISEAFAYSLRHGDSIQCLYRSEEDEWWWDVPVHHVYRHANGGVHVGLSKILIDPPDSTRPSPNYYIGVWHTEVDGDLMELLEASPVWEEWKP